MSVTILRLFVFLMCLLLVGPPAQAFIYITGGAGTTPQVDCDDVAGQHTNFDLTTRTWTCGVSSSGGVPGNAFADGVTKGVATFAAAEFVDNGSGVIGLGTTLANKTLSNTNTVTLKDGSFTLQNTANTGRQLRFDLTNITIGQLRTLTVPNLTDTLVTRTSADTLTNKTLTGATISSPTGLVKADVGLGNVDNTSNATERSAAALLSNKTLDATNAVTLTDTLFRLQAAGDPTKQALWNLAALTTGTVRTYGLPDASDTLMCLTCQQSPTNKTFSGATNTFSALPDTALTFTDVTTGNASASAHGFLPKLPGGTTTFLNAAGSFTTPAGAAPTVQCAEDGTHALNYTTALGWVCGLINAGTPGGGDFSSNTATAVDSEIVLFSGTGGKTGKRSTGSGMAKLTAGVLSVVTAPTGAVVGTTDTQTLTNKTFDNTNIVVSRDDRFTLQDNVDPTKQAAFQLSGITAGQTRTYTVPDFSGTLATLAGAETLSNKTLTSSTFTTSLSGPLLLGGSSASAALTLQSTSGVGTTDHLDFRTGSNGAVLGMTLDTLGNIGMGLAAPLTKLHILGPSLDVRHTGNATQQTITSSVYDNNTTLEGRLAYLGAASAGSRAFALLNDAADYLDIRSVNATEIRLGTTNVTRMVLGATALLSFGATGSTNPAFFVDGTAASAATGVGITGQAAGTAPTLQTISSGTNEGLSINAKGSGDLNFHTTSTGNMVLGGNTARVVSLARHTTADTAGSGMTLTAGGATLAATNKAGGDLLLRPGVSTGTANARVYIEGSAPAAVSGTGDQALIHREIIGYSKALTNNTTTTIATLTLASNTGTSVFFDYAIEVVDAANHVQHEEGKVSCAAINEAGVITRGGTSGCTKICTQTALSAATTLTVTFTLTSASPSLLQANANSSLTPVAGYPRLTLRATNTASQQVAMN